MKLLFDLTPIFDHLTGIERYNINITKEIIKAHPENEYILLFKNEVHDSFKNEVMQSNVEYKLIPECNKLVFIQWKLYRILKSVEADYYIFLSFTSPILFRKKRIINAIHDLTCWDCPESWRLVTVSKFSQKRICEKYGLGKNQVPVIYDGLTDIFSKESHNNPDLKNKYHLPDRYILSLSTIEPRKNLQLLISAYKEMIDEGENLPDLVLAGREGWILEDIVGTIDEKVKNRIHFTGFIDDDDLAQIYREAELFVFPSKYEGFGLPVIEAMSQGTLVVCSDAASLPEVAGDAGLLFKSDDLGQLKEVIQRVINLNDEKVNEMIELGYIHSSLYNWRNEAEKLHSLLL